MKPADVFKDYEPFYNMVLSTALMTNCVTDEFDGDARKIINFIGDAYGLSAEKTDFFTDIILNRISSVKLLTDCEATYGQDCFGEHGASSEDALDAVKANVIYKISHLTDNNVYNDVNPEWFNYGRPIVYQPEMRFYAINATAATGNVTAVRQAGILRMLGIGCKVDRDDAVWRFLQCAVWGDIPSMRFLSYAWKLIGNDEKHALYGEVAELCNTYLKTGRTILPAGAKKKYSEKACTYYVYISSIKQDVIFAYNLKNIVFSFTEALMSKSLDYFDRMNLINNFDKKEWKNITNSSNKPKEKLGFI